MAAAMSSRLSPHLSLFAPRFVTFHSYATGLFPSPLAMYHRNPCSLTKSIQRCEMACSTSNSAVRASPVSGVEDAMMDYFFGKKRATEVAHSMWTRVIRSGDVLVDATCGNGYDTVAMVKMVAGKSPKGRVYAIDIQKVALENTVSLLDESLTPDEKELVETFTICHSKMEEVLPKGAAVRLVAFNLGYLPGGDKAIITSLETTTLALEAARRVVAPGGLISIVVYVGHPGGREEYEAVQDFASGLPVDDWICSKLQTLNRPLAPILLFLFRR